MIQFPYLKSCKINDIPERMSFKIFFIIIFLFFLNLGYSQNDNKTTSHPIKGVSLLGSDSSLKPKTTRAVIIGISIYPNLTQDLQLHFADKDARDFYYFLRHKPYPVDSSNIKLLTNENAVIANLNTALTWLDLESKQGDDAIIYVSGHGDVLPLSGGGYLLLHDVKKNNYLGGDVLEMDAMIRFINKLSVQKKVNVYFFADACRVGNLLGGNSKFELIKLLTNEMGSINKFLSCGENQESQELDQLHNGVFTYYLIKGLSGLADKDNDDIIAGWEICNYLREKVSIMTKRRQTPICSMDESKNITYFDLKIKNNLEKEEQTNLLAINEKPKGEGQYPAFSSDSIFQNYINNINILLDQGKIIEPFNDNAWYYFNNLERAYSNTTNPVLENLKYQLITRSVDDAQRLMNQYLNGGNKPPLSRSYLKASDELKEVIAHLDEDHFLIGSLKAKQKFFEGIAIAQSGKISDFPYAISLWKESLKYDSLAVYSLRELGDLSSFMNDFTSAEKMLNKAIHISLKWIPAYVSLSKNYIYQGRYIDAFKCIDKALEIDSNSWEANLGKGYLLYYGYDNNHGDYNKATGYLKKAISLLPEKSNERSDTYLLLGWIYKSLYRPELSIQSYKNGIESDSLYVRNYIHLGAAYIYRNADSALMILNKARELAPNDPELLEQFGEFYQHKQDYDSAEYFYQKAISNNPLYYHCHIALSDFYLERKDTLESEKILINALHICNNSSYILEALGDHYLSRNMYNKAEEYYLTALNSAPNYLPVYNKLFKVFDLTNNREKLLNIQKRIFASAPNYAQFPYLTGIYYINKDSLETGLDWLIKTMVMDSGFINKVAYLKRASINNTIKEKYRFFNLITLICSKADYYLIRKDTLSALKLLMKAKEFKWFVSNDYYRLMKEISKILYANESKYKDLFDLYLNEKLLTEEQRSTFYDLYINNLLDAGKVSEAGKFIFDSKVYNAEIDPSRYYLCCSFVEDASGKEKESIGFFQRAIDNLVPFEYESLWLYCNTNGKNFQGGAGKRMRSVYFGFYKNADDPTLLTPEEFELLGNIYISNDKSTFEHTMSQNPTLERKYFRKSFNIFKTCSYKAEKVPRFPVISIIPDPVDARSDQLFQEGLKDFFMNSTEESLEHFNAYYKKNKHSYTALFYRGLAKYFNCELDD